MAAATFLAIFFVPLFFVLLRKLSKGKARPEASGSGPAAPRLPAEDTR
jgi:hypothetical protein